MKKAICALLLSVFSVASLRAESSESADAVTTQDGRLYWMQGDKMQLLTNVLKMPFDVVVNTNDTFKVADGKPRQLLEGPVLQRDGWLLSPDGSVQPVVDHVVMNQGKVYVVRDGQPQVLNQPMTFPNNLYINPDGSCVYPSGSSTRLMDGQLFRLDGTPILSKDTISLKNGRVVVQKEGKLIPLTPVQVMGMNDGTSVRGDGFIQKRDGTSFQLSEGQTILVDGALVVR